MDHSVLSWAANLIANRIGDPGIAFLGNHRPNEIHRRALASCTAGFQLSRIGFRVSGFGSRDSGFGFGGSGPEFRVSGPGFRVSGFRFRVSGFRFRVSG